MVRRSNKNFAGTFHDYEIVLSSSTSSVETCETIHDSPDFFLSQLSQINEPTIGEETVGKWVANGLFQSATPNCIKDFLDLQCDSGQSGLAF